MTSALNLMKAARFAPMLPWNVTDYRQLGPAVTQYVSDQEPFFRRWAEKWWENFQFLYGNQAIKWSRRLGFAVDYDYLQRSPVMSQRAQTNLARVVCESLASMIYAQLPEWEIESADESSVKSARLTKITQRLLDAYMYRLNMDKEFQTASLIYTAFGQVASEVLWDSTAGRIIEVPKMRKVMAPVYTTYMAPNPITGGLFEVPTQALDSNSQPLQRERWETVTDHMGRQIIDRLWAGDTAVNMLTPFEYQRDIGSDGMHKTKSVRRFRFMDYDEFLEFYGNIGGKTPYFDRVQPVQNDPTINAMAVRYFMRMQFTTPPTMDDIGGRPDSVFNTSTFRQKVFVIEHWDKPHPKKWPTGRRVIVANGMCTHITKPSYMTNKLDGWHPFSEAQWLVIKPSSIASGPLNDVINKNREFNVKKSLTATALRRNMGSMLLYKKNIGFDPQKMSGEPGQTHEVFDPFAIRYLNDEHPIPAVLPTLEAADKDEIYESSGALEALRGERTPGVSSGYHAKQIQEREERRLSAARKAFEVGLVGGTGEKILACIKFNARARLDDSVMGYLRRAGAGEFSVSDVVAFLSSPIDYGIDIKVKKSSMALRSKATEEATAQELASGVASSQMQDRKVLDRYLEYFGVDVLRDDSRIHRDRASSENETFLDILRLGTNAEGVTHPTVLFEDDDDIHEAEHDLLFLKYYDEFMANEAAMIEFLIHKERHRIQREEKQAKALPGTSLQAAGMMATSRQIPTPTVQTIHQHSMMERQRQAQQQQQQQPPQGQPQGQPGGPPPGGGQAPGSRAPRQPGVPGPRPMNPGAAGPTGPAAAARGM